MKKYILFLLPLLLGLSIFNTVTAKEGKIKYGKYIYYEGNVENGKMKGQGTLYIKAKIPGNEGKVLIGDEITGIFENNQITSCSIKFGSGWSYEGDAIVNILKEKNELTLQLNNGNITTDNGTKIQNLSKVQYSISVKKVRDSDVFQIYFNHGEFDAEINNFLLNTKVAPVDHRSNNKGSLEGFTINKTGIFKGIVNIPINNGSSYPLNTFKWNYEIRRGRFTGSDGSFCDVIRCDFGRDYFFNDILMNESNGDYTLYGGDESAMTDNCRRYVKKIKRTLSNGAIIEGNRTDRMDIAGSQGYKFKGKIQYPNKEYYEGIFALTGGNSNPTLETILKNITKNETKLWDGYGYSNGLTLINGVTYFTDGSTGVWKEGKMTKNLTEKQKQEKLKDIKIYRGENFEIDGSGNINYTFNDIEYQYYMDNNTEIKHGLFRCWNGKYHDWGRDNCSIKGEYEHGKKNGLWILELKDPGNRDFKQEPQTERLTVNCKNGSIDGCCILEVLDANGSLKFKNLASYKEGKWNPRKEYKYMTKTYTIETKLNYDEAGELHGNIYIKNGDIELRETYEHGKLIRSVRRNIKKGVVLTPKPNESNFDVMNKDIKIILPLESKVYDTLPKLFISIQ